jgi:hypothetical protein
MAEKEKDIKVTVEEDQPELALEPAKVEGPKVEAKVELEPEEKVEISPEDAIAELNKRLAEEKAARLEAEKRAHEASQEARKANNTVEDTNLQLLNSAIEQVKRDSEILKANYRAAMANNDYDAAADIQQSMSMASARLLQLETGKTAMENAPRGREQEASRYSDPVEAFASRLTPRSASWVRSHPQCVTDPRLNQKMIAAHNIAVADGFEPDSDDYFNFVEQTVGIGKKVEPVEQVVSEAAKPVQRRVSPASAPVSRSNTSTGARNGTYTLTRDEADAAAASGLSNEEYVKNKLLLKKEGRLH